MTKAKAAKPKAGKPKEVLALAAAREARNAARRSRAKQRRAAEAAMAQSPIWEAGTATLFPGDVVLFHFTGRTYATGTRSSGRTVEEILEDHEHVGLTAFDDYAQGIAECRQACGEPVTSFAILARRVSKLTASTPAEFIQLTPEAFGPLGPSAWNVIALGIKPEAIESWRNAAGKGSFGEHEHLVLGKGLTLAEAMALAESYAPGAVMERCSCTAKAQEPGSAEHPPPRALDASVDWELL